MGGDFPFMGGGPPPSPPCLAALSSLPSLPSSSSLFRGRVGGPQKINKIRGIHWITRGGGQFGLIKENPDFTYEN